MENKNLHKIFEQTDCQSRANMLRYIQGKLSVNEQFLFEKHLHACSICHDEYEGLLAMQNHDKLPEIVAELNGKIDKSLQYSSKKIFLKDYRFLRIAALVLVLVGSGFFMNYYLQFSSKNYTAQEMVSQNVEESLDEAESISEGYLAESETKESVPVTELKSEPINEDRKGNLTVDNPEELSETRTNSNTALGMVDDEISDTEVDISDVAIESEENIREERTIITENSGGGVSDNKQISTDELVVEEDVAEINELATYDDKNKADEESPNYNVSRAKMLSSKKMKTKEESYAYQQQGIDAYYEGNYAEASVALNNSLAYETTDDKTRFYLSQTYVAQSDTKNALIQLNKLLKNKKSTYKNEAMWEKAQLLIKMEKRKSAINVLNDLIKVNSPYKIEAQQKLDSLLLN